MPGKVLIIDDLATNRIILKVKLTAAYYEVLQAASVDDACALLTDWRPDVILLGQRAGNRETLKPAILRLQTQETNGLPIPVIALLDSPDSEDRISALIAGADDVLAAPLDEQLLLARLRGLMRQRLTDQDLHNHSLTAHAMGFAEAQLGFDSPGRICLVADDRQAARKLQSRLRPKMRHNLRMMSAEDVMGALSNPTDTLNPSINAAMPDVFLMQLSDPDPLDGFRRLSELRADHRTRSCPVIALLPENDTLLASQLLDLGAGDVVYANSHPDEIAIRLGNQLGRKRQRDRLYDRLKDGLQAAVIDPLTGLYNRRYAMSYLNCLLEGQTKENDGFAVMVADLDHFKQVNDTFGHAGGDAVLKNVAKLLKAQLRKDDLVARIGGEEFLIIVPTVSQDRAQTIATKICATIRDAVIPMPGRADTAQVTISIGLTLANSQSGTPEEIMDQADRALYRSKAEGRNTVRFMTPSAA